MDLRQESKIASPECFVCRWAGKHIIIWPKEPVTPPEEIPPSEGISLKGEVRVTLPSVYTQGSWWAYIKVEEEITTRPGGLTMRSRHTTINVCVDHWYKLEYNWVAIAWQEVALDYVWNAYLDRMEQ